MASFKVLMSGTPCFSKRTHLMWLLFLIFTMTTAHQSSLNQNTPLESSKSHMSVNPDWNRQQFQLTIVSKLTDTDYSNNHFSRKDYNNQNKKTSSYSYKNTKSHIDETQRAKFRMELGIASINILFIMSIWRCIVLYDLATSFTSPVLKSVSTLPLQFLLILNVLSLFVNLLRPMQYKNILKIAMGLNIVKEWVDLAYNLFIIVFGPSILDLQTPQEIQYFTKGYFFGRLMLNMWFLVSGIAQLRSRWVFQARPRMRSQTATFQNDNKHF